MAITLWSRKTPGAAQLERDLAVMNNKKKVRQSYSSENIMIKLFCLFVFSKVFMERVLL